MAQAAGGTFLLRIEDIDTTRSKLQWEAQIYDDLGWLGLSWPTPVMRQSERLDHYGRALDDLWARGMLYPCYCSRADISAAASAPQEGVPRFGPDGVIYPGTCRHKTPRKGERPTDLPLRLDIAKAAEMADSLQFEETGTQAGYHQVSAADLKKQAGDVVLSRRDMGTSYHLSVVLDDAAQGITHVVRGEDLFEATQIHVFLQHLLGLDTPLYHHHRLIRDQNGKRLAKRDDARAIATYRAEGMTPEVMLDLLWLQSRNR